ncbi:MFS transporter [Novosphingobium sp. PASSN1]|uniref:MFS transporter n=1 Tax=Novosphingobium sp. PASSN1 TaxID=2015561 RepID=UPI000BD5FC8B|nr:MFS transporter [Novosphingobium sp. PASSN1]OYU34588.1 MAG: MFS transporter [Novosphingobium sp. PASSN1]
MDHAHGTAGSQQADTAPFLLTLIGIGAATAAAHIGNNFTTYLVGGLMDRFGFTPFAMGAWNMAETLSYAAAMFLVAPRARGLDARVLAMIASAVVIAAQAGSALTGAYPLLLAGRIGTGLGFGLMNSALNLAAGRTGNPARWISLGIAVQTLLYSGIAIVVPMIGRDYGAEGMFFGLAGISVLFGLCALLLPGGKGAVENGAEAAVPIGAEGWRVLLAMALFSFGSLAIWPFIERTAHAIGIPATQFGLYQSAAVLASAVGNAGLALVIGRLPRAWPLAAALGACAAMCGLLTTVGSAPAFGAAFVAFMVSWFLTYPLLIRLAYAQPAGERLAVMTSGTWLLAQSLGSLAAGAMAQGFGAYTLIGPVGGVICALAIAAALPVARRLDREAA